MSAGYTTRNNITYLDHAPEEIPPLTTKKPRKQLNVPSIGHFQRFEGEAPPLSRDREPDYVDDYYGRFYCPVCYLWRTSGESRAIRACGHVICAPCWDDWAQASGRGPVNNRLTTCPICRVEVNHSATREVDFRASRFNSDTAVATHLAKRVSELREGNIQLRRTLKELRDSVALLETQRQMLLDCQAEMTTLAENVERMAICD